MSNKIPCLQAIYQENKEMQIEIEKYLLELREELDEVKQQLYRLKGPQPNNQQFFSPIAAATYEKIEKLEEEQKSLLQIIRYNEKNRDRLKEQNEVLKGIVKELRDIPDKDAMVSKLRELKNVIMKDPEKAEYMIEEMMKEWMK